MAKKETIEATESYLRTLYTTIEKLSDKELLEKKAELLVKMRSLKDEVEQAANKVSQSYICNAALAKIDKEIQRRKSK